MVLLYYRIFKAIHDRAKKPIGSVKTSGSTVKSEKALVIENPSQTRLKSANSTDSEEGAGVSGPENVRNRRIIEKIRHDLPLITETDAMTNNGSGSVADEDEDSDLERVECQIIKNEQTVEYNVNVNITRSQVGHPKQDRLTPTQDRLTPNAITDVDFTTTTTNGNTTDSGYVTTEPIDVRCQTPSLPLVISNPVSTGSPADDLTTTVAVGTLGAVSGSTVSGGGRSVSFTPIEKKRSRFNLGRKHKSSKKKREKLCNRRERKATKTLAIVLGK